LLACRIASHCAAEERLLLLHCWGVRDDARSRSAALASSGSNTSNAECLVHLDTSERIFFFFMMLDAPVG
jgi:hypothetical protein